MKFNIKRCLSLPVFLVTAVSLTASCVQIAHHTKDHTKVTKVQQETNQGNSKLAKAILADSSFNEVLARAKKLIASGFNAGEGYNEVWIRDFTTFIELAMEAHSSEVIRNKLLMFFRFQGEDGNIVDGYVPASQAQINYDYIRKKTIPDYVAHKNTVETDQESSLIQAVYLYVQYTGDSAFLNETVDGQSILTRMGMAIDFLQQHRYSQQYGLLWGATTADWGDVQPEHNWGVVLDENSHRSIDIYDNAMYVIALKNYLALLPENSQDKQAKQTILADTTANIRQHLWDEKNVKYIPHIYLEGSPFPDSFDENSIYYHGGTAIAIQAELLSPQEIKLSLEKMQQNVKESGAPSIGLTLYPVYPEGYFKNGAMIPYGYQNGGDWTWFGARMIQQLVRNGFVDEAYQEIQPMIARAIKNQGFYEWYHLDGKPTGSGSFRGSAGVLGKSILLLQDWAEQQSVLVAEDK